MLSVPSDVNASGSSGPPRAAGTPKTTANPSTVTAAMLNRLIAHLSGSLRAARNTIPPLPDAGRVVGTGSHPAMIVPLDTSGGGRPQELLKQINAGVQSFACGDRRGRSSETRVSGGTSPTRRP